MPGCWLLRPCVSAPQSWRRSVSHAWARRVRQRTMRLFTVSTLLLFFSSSGTDTQWGFLRYFRLFYVEIPTRLILCFGVFFCLWSFVMWRSHFLPPGGRSAHILERSARKQTSSLFKVLQFSDLDSSSSWLKALIRTLWLKYRAPHLYYW